MTENTEHQLIRDFLLRYKALVTSFHRATEPQDFVRLLLDASGQRLNPWVIFHEDGHLRPNLRQIAHQQLVLLIKDAYKPLDSALFGLSTLDLRPVQFHPVRGAKARSALLARGMQDIGRFVEGNGRIR